MTFLIHEPELNCEKTLFIKLRIKSCHRHYICLKPREQNKEYLILHKGIANDGRLYFIIKSKGTFFFFCLGTKFSETLKEVQ